MWVRTAAAIADATPGTSANRSDRLDRERPALTDALFPAPRPVPRAFRSSGTLASRRQKSKLQPFI